MSRMEAMSEEQVVNHVLRYKSDYYRILMVERSATNAQIRAAYKKMAIKCHPDKNKNPMASDAFKLVGTAHATLSDDTKRTIYDRQGAAGVQRHESTGGRGGGGGARGAAGPRYRPGGNPQRDFFEEFFFGGGGGNFPGTGGARPRAGGANGNAQHVEFDFNPGFLMLIPVIIFILLALILQSGFTDVDTYSSGVGARGGAAPGTRNTAATSFSLTPSPEEGFVIRRTTSLYGLSVPYYTSRRWAEVMERRRDAMMATEQEVLKTQRDYLANRCEAETFKHRTRGRKDAPEVCTEYNHFRRALG